METKVLPDRQWSQREDLVVRIIAPEMAAEKLMLPVDAIKARRTTLGLGKFVARRKWKQRNQAAAPAKPR
jgi:hypothetical protein